MSKESAGRDTIAFNSWMISNTGTKPYWLQQKYDFGCLDVHMIIQRVDRNDDNLLLLLWRFRILWNHRKPQLTCIFRENLINPNNIIIALRTPYSHAIIFSAENKAESHTQSTKEKSVFSLNQQKETQLESKF